MGLLRTYRFIDKDPVCDELRTIVHEAGLSKKLRIVAELANLHHSTIKNLFHGATRRPQNATVMAIGTSLGYKREWVKDRELNVEEELVFARQWNKREKEKQEANRAPRKRKKTRARAA